MKKRPLIALNGLWPVTSSMWVIKLNHFSKPACEEKQYGPGGGIPSLKAIWEMFDLSLLFSQSGIRKHSGISTWLLAFSYICGWIANVGSVNQNAKYASESPLDNYRNSKEPA